MFRAWTDPEALAAWYGPAHLETPRDRIRVDLRVGGRYELTMLMPGGGVSAPGVGVGLEVAARRSSGHAPRRSRLTTAEELVMPTPRVAS